MPKIFDLFVSIALLATTVPARADFQKYKIAVLDFQLQGRGHGTDDMGKIVAEWLITALVKAGRFEVIERRMLARVMEEQQLAMTGVVDANSASRLGKLLGVRTIVSGSVVRLENIVEVNARIIDVESASILAAENVRSVSNGDMEPLIDQLAEKIIRDFPLEGYIVKRADNTLTLDLGSSTGVSPGMRFMVFREGAAIRHPKTGEVLDVQTIETGSLRITQVRRNISEAEILTEEAPGSIEYGQLVKSWLDAEPPPLVNGRLFVATTPADASVRLQNSGEPYHPGIELPPGEYPLEVAAAGHVTHRQTVSIDARDVSLEIALVPVPVPAQAVAPSSIPVKAAASPSEAPRPEAVPAPPARQYPFRVGIFPWFLKGDAVGYKARLINIISPALSSAVDFKLVYCAFDNRLPGVRLPRDGGPDVDTLEGIWKKRHILAQPEPDPERTSRFGRELGLDAVIAGFMGMTVRYGDAYSLQGVEVFIVDVPSGKVISTGKYPPMSTVEDALGAMVVDCLAKYRTHFR